jgi:hypothetical protein
MLTTGAKEAGGGEPINIVTVAGDDKRCFEPGKIKTVLVSNT